MERVDQLDMELFEGFLPALLEVYKCPLGLPVAGHPRNWKEALEEMDWDNDYEGDVDVRLKDSPIHSKAGNYLQSDSSWLS